MSLTAPVVMYYMFQNWDVDGVSQGSGINSISVSMNAPHTAIAYYEEIDVGGSAISIESPLLHAWISFNAMLITAVFLTASLVRRRQKETS